MNLHEFPDFGSQSILNLGLLFILEVIYPYTYLKMIHLLYYREDYQHLLQNTMDKGMQINIILVQ